MLRVLDPSVAEVALNLVKREKAYRQEYVERRRREGWLDHCVHGVYIGTPFGPDYMCGRCEDGETPGEVYAEAIAEAKRRVAKGRELLNAAITLSREGFIDEDTARKVFVEVARILND